MFCTDNFARVKQLSLIKIPLQSTICKEEHFLHEYLKLLSWMFVSCCLTWTILDYCSKPNFSSLVTIPYNLCRQRFFQYHFHCLQAPQDSRIINIQTSCQLELHVSHFCPTVSAAPPICFLWSTIFWPIISSNLPFCTTLQINFVPCFN